MRKFKMPKIKKPKMPAGMKRKATTRPRSKPKELDLMGGPLGGRQKRPRGGSDPFTMM